MEAITFRRARTPRYARTRRGLVHLAEDSPRGLLRAVCGVAVARYDAEPSADATCPACLRIVS